MTTLRIVLDGATRARVADYAAARDLSVEAAAADLVAMALEHHDAWRRAGQARMQGTSARERRELARRAAQARWAKQSKETRR